MKGCFNMIVTLLIIIVLILILGGDVIANLIIYGVVGLLKLGALIGGLGLLYLIVTNISDKMFLVLLVVAMAGGTMWTIISMYLEETNED